MGRILRVGNDTVVNYTLLATTDYNSDDPAATTSPWPDTPAMDQLFDQPAPIIVENQQGVLVTFERFPDRFWGVKVKIRANYDRELNEEPTLEVWTHDSLTTEWTKRFNRPLASVFSGAPTGRVKIHNMTDGFGSLLNVDQVWITMNPGTEGAPTMDWYSIQLYGVCEDGQRGGGGGGDPCDETNPNYTGFIDPVTFEPTSSATTGAIPCPTETWTSGPPCFDPDNDGICNEPDYCNESSIQDYREFLRATTPTFLPIFDAWLDANRATIAAFCDGTGGFPGDDPPAPPIPPPPPKLILCDDDSIAAFRAAVSGDAERLAEFDAYIDGLTASGFFEVACGDDDPVEQYVDPETMQPAAMPPPVFPFDAGPGSLPVIPRRADEDEDDDPPGAGLDELTKRFILTWSGNDTDEAVTLTDSLIAPLPPSTEDQTRETLTGNYGPNAGISTYGFHFTPAPYGITINLSKLPFTCRVGVRCQVFRLRDTNNLRFSIDDTGIATNPAQGGCPAGPDWTETLGTGFTPAGNVLIGNDYREYVFEGAAFRNNTTIALTMPRVNASQDDYLPCDPDYEPRSRLAYQRAACIDIPIAHGRMRWLHDISTEDYDSSGPAENVHVPPICIVLDVQLFSITVPGATRVLGLAPSDIELSFPADAQPVEDCS